MKEPLSTEQELARFRAALEQIAKGPVSYQLIIIATDALMRAEHDPLCNSYTYPGFHCDCRTDP